MDVLDAVGGLVHAARLTATATLVRGIGGDRDVALFGHVLGIQACDLSLHTAIGVGHDDRWIFLLRIEVRRGVDVGDDVQAIELVLHRVDVDFAWFVLRDRTGIDKRERILLVVSCGCSGGFGHARNSNGCN